MVDQDLIADMERVHGEIKQLREHHAFKGSEHNIVSADLDMMRVQLYLEDAMEHLQEEDW